VVRDHVNEQPEPEPLERIGEAGERVLAAELRTQTTVIGDVVPVGAGAARLEERGGIAVADTERGQVSVTMIKPAAVNWNEVQVGQVFQGKVIRIEKFGIFVDIGAERPGLVHISELSSDYVASANDVVEKGAEVEVKVINVNRKKNQIDLSMKALSVPVKMEEVVGDEEKMPTAMELAFQKAKEGREKEQVVSTAKDKAAQRAERQEEALRRTLQRLENQ